MLTTSGSQRCAGRGAYVTETGKQANINSSNNGNANDTIIIIIILYSSNNNNN